MSATVEPVVRTESDTPSPRRDSASTASSDPDGGARLRGIAMRRAQRTRAAAAQARTEGFMRDQTANAAIDGRMRVERGPDGMNRVVPTPSAMATAQAQRAAPAGREMPRVEPPHPAPRPPAPRIARARPAPSHPPAPERAEPDAAPSPRPAPAPVPPEPFAFSQPAVEPSETQLAAELATGRTTEDRRALAAEMLERFRGEVERVKGGVAADGERQKSDVEARAEGSTASIRRTAAAQTRAVRTAFAAAKSRLRADGDQHKTAVVRGAAESRRNAQQQTAAEANATDAELTRRRTELQTFIRNERAQPRAIADSEAERARRELTASAAEAIRIGEAEAALHPDGSSEYAADQRAAARQLARETAADMLGKVGPLRDELREKAADHAGRYQAYGDQAAREIDEARPMLRTAIREAFDSSIAGLDEGQPAALESIDQRVAADVAALTAAEWQAVSSIDAAARDAVGDARRIASETTAAIDRAAEETVARIDATSAGVAASINGEPDPVVDDVRNLTASAAAQITEAASEARTRSAEGAANATRQIVAGETRLQTMAAETQSGAAQRAATVIERAAATMQRVVASRAAHDRQVVESIAARQRAIRTDALRDLDAGLARVRADVQAVTAEFRAQATPIANDAITEARKPLTDPLWERVKEAAATAGRIIAGIVVGLLELVAGLLLVIAIAVILVLLSPLTLGAAILVVGLTLLVLGAAVTAYQRHQQDPTASAGTIALRTLGDITGVTGIIEAVTNRDIVTGQTLGAYEASRRGTVGLGSLLLLVFGVRGAFKGGGLRPPGGWTKTYTPLLEGIPGRAPGPMQPGEFFRLNLRSLRESWRSMLRRGQNEPAREADPRRPPDLVEGPLRQDGEGFPLIEDLVTRHNDDPNAVLDAFIRFLSPERAAAVEATRMRLGPRAAVQILNGAQRRGRSIVGLLDGEWTDAARSAALEQQRARSAQQVAADRPRQTGTAAPTPAETVTEAEGALRRFLADTGPRPQGAVGEGTDAQAIIHEAATGLRTKGRYHGMDASDSIAAALEQINYLRRLGRVYDLPASALEAIASAELRIAELRSVLENYWNVRSTRYPQIWNPDGSLRTPEPSPFDRRVPSTLPPPPVPAFDPAREGVQPVQRRIVQRHCACGGTCGPCASAAIDENRRVIQLRAAGDFASESAVVPGGGGEPMSEATRASMESRFRADFRDVRVHADGAAASAAGAMGAEAFTSGRDVYFAAGRYAPQSEDGQRLLAHELAHVVQQSGGEAPQRVAGQLGDGAVVGAHDDPLEREADRTADTVMRGENAPAATSDASGSVRRNILGDAGRAIGGAVVSGAEYVGGKIEDAYDAAADWVVSQIDRIAPGLRQFLGDPAGFIQERIESAVGGLFGDLYTRISREGLLGAIESTATGVVGALTAGAGELGSGLCSAVAGAAQLLFDAVRAIAGPAFAAARTVFSAVGSFFSWLWTSYLGPAWDAIKAFAVDAWHWIAAKARWVWDLIEPIRSGVTRIWNWIKRQFGIAWSTGAGVLDWLKDLAARAWNWVKAKLAPIMGPLRTIAITLLALSPIGPIIAIVAAAPHVWHAIRWLFTNWGPDMLVRARRVLNDEIFPALRSGVATVGALLATAAAWLRAQLGALLGALGGLAEALGAHAFLAAARNAIVWVADHVRAFVEWAGTAFVEFVETARAVLVRIWEFLRPAVIIGAKLAIAVTNPFMLTLVFASWGWLLLPPCFKPPIVAFLLDALIGAVGAIPEFRSFGETWARVRALILQHLRTAQRATVEEQIKISNRVANVIGGSDIDAYGNLFEGARKAIPIFPGAFQEELIGMQLTEPLPFERREAALAMPAAMEQGLEAARPGDPLLARPLTSSDFEVADVADLDPELVPNLGLRNDGEPVEFGENPAAPSNEDVQQQLAAPAPAAAAPAAEPAQAPAAAAEPRTPDQQIDDLLAQEEAQTQVCGAQQAPPARESAAAVPEAARQFGPFTLMQRARYLMGKMTAAASQWYQCHRTAIIVGVIAALVVIIIAAIFTGGGALEAVPAIVEVLGTIMIGVAIVNIAGKIAEYVGKAILGDPPGAAVALAHGLAAGAIELIFALVFAGAAAAAQRMRALLRTSIEALARTRGTLGGIARGTLRAVERGRQLVQQGRQLLREAGQATRQFFIRSGKVMIRSLGRGFSRGIRRLEDLARRLWDLMPFHRYKLTFRDWRLTLWGSRSPWVRIAELLIRAQEAVDAQTEAARMGRLTNNPFPEQSIAVSRSVNRTRAAIPVHSPGSMRSAETFLQGQGHVYVPGDIGTTRGFQAAEQLGLGVELPNIPGLARAQPPVPLQPRMPGTPDVRPWHSEIQMAMTRGGTEHGIGSMLNMCSRCRQFFPPYARSIGADIVIADPDWIWFFMRGPTVRIPRATFDPLNARIIARINDPAAVEVELRTLARMLGVRLP